MNASRREAQNRLGVSIRRSNSCRGKITEAIEQMKLNSRINNEIMCDEIIAKFGYLPDNILEKQEDEEDKDSIEELKGW